MSFTQAAFTDTQEAERQLIAYFQGLQVTRSWPAPIVGGLVTWVQSVGIDNAPSLFWNPGVDSFWAQIAAEFSNEINALTNNDPSMLAGINSVAAVLGAGQMTAQAQVEGTGITGAWNVVTETVEEKATDQRKRNEQFEKWAPLILPTFALAALYVGLKGLK